MSPHAIRNWISVNWIYAGLTAGIFLLTLLPLLWNLWSLPLLLVFLQLPAYMVHQVEEHHQDRFRSFVNWRLAAGRNALTTPAVLVINLAGVWLVDLVALYLTVIVRPGLGLIAIYLALVNAATHILAAILLRAYNPGLITAIVLLLPLGAAAWWAVIRSGQCTPWDHVVGLACALAIHIALIAHISYRASHLASAPANL